MLNKKIKALATTFGLFAYFAAVVLNGSGSTPEISVEASRATNQPTISTSQPEDIDLSAVVIEENSATHSPIGGAYIENVEHYKTAEEVADSPDETVFTTMETQSGVTWGLDRIDGTVDGSYSYVSSGSGVRIYIVDTGVDALHPELGGRVADGFDAFGQNLDQTDCNGHGTHVAGIAAGSYFGVAKSATIVPVRVLDCNGAGNTTTLTDGIDWILASHSGGIGIVNMSLGGNKNDEVNAATSKLISAGLVVIAAAGNSNVDACTFSPASAQGVIAVGAIGQDGARASFSNWGGCVDIMAPGVGINSANSADYSSAKRRSGTSQASPFVAGAIATYLSNKSVTSPSQAQSYLEKMSPEGIVRTEPAPQEEAQPSPEPTVDPEPVIPEPEPYEPPAVDEPILPDPGVIDLPVKVTQVGAGSYDGLLEWTLVDGAEQYRIYKTSSIRPGWRLYWVEDGPWNYQTIVDKPGTIAIYRVSAVIGGKEIVVGEFKYEPTS